MVKRTCLVFFAVLFLISMIVVVAALETDTNTIMVYSKPDKDSCQSISLTFNSSKIEISDKWAENENTEWSASLFNKQADYHGLQISYPKDISESGRQAEICIRGSKPGIYHGILVLKETINSSIFQTGVWLDVTIAKPEEKITEKNLSEQKEGVTGKVVLETGKKNSTLVAIIVLAGILGLAGVFYYKNKKAKSSAEKSAIRLDLPVD